MRTLLSFMILTAAVAQEPAALHLGQGSLCGEITDRSALLQTRLTASSALNAEGDLPGAAGVVSFEWSSQADFSNSERTPFQTATAERDFIVRAALTGLTASTTYYYRPLFGVTESTAQPGATSSFTTLQGASGKAPVRFIVGSYMNLL
jgi:phosphodiesterase/alkaline phosphatase D-like protein